MKILVTNDDGIQSEGILELARALEEVAEVWVVAPDREQSAVSHALSMGRPLRSKRVESLGPRYFAVNGTPTDCVLLGVNRIMPERPNLIVSGINKGENLGDDITYSGTVSAAIEATILGIPSFAISLTARKNFDFSQTASFAVRLSRHILELGLPRHTFLNVNVPCKDENPAPTRSPGWGSGSTATPFRKREDRWGRKYYVIGGNDPGYLETDRFRL